MNRSISESSRLNRREILRFFPELDSECQADIVVAASAPNTGTSEISAKSVSASPTATSTMPTKRKLGRSKSMCGRRKYLTLSAKRNLMILIMCLCEAASIRAESEPGLREDYQDRMKVGKEL